LPVAKPVLKAVFAAQARSMALAMVGFADTVEGSPVHAEQGRLPAGGLDPIEIINRRTTR
jgi:hypothetical protein